MTETVEAPENSEELSKAPEEAPKKTQESSKTPQNSPKKAGGDIISEVTEALPEGDHEDREIPRRV